jgi:N-acetylglucosamine malate deacetylase 1
VKGVLVIGPHADDETLGAGASLLRWKAEGARLHWLNVTQISEETGWSGAAVAQREREVNAVSAAYAFDSVAHLRLPPAQLETQPRRQLVQAISHVVEQHRPELVLLPFCNDAHSDHRIVFEAAHGALKIFRAPSVRHVWMMEIPSETDHAPPGLVFAPQVFIDVSSTFARKAEILSLYEGELGQHPFPRSLVGVEALARLRGAQAGCLHAEAFMVVRSVW